MNSAGLVSVIIPVYNSAGYIKEALESVFSQTYRNFQVIVVDDGSTDDTAKAMRPYLDRIIYIKKENTGPAGARNRGVKESHGEYISFLDSDDLYLPNRLQEGISFFAKNPKSDIIFSRFELIGQPIADKFAYIANVGDGRIFNNLLRGNFICTSTVMLRRQCLGNETLFDEDRKLISVEDYNLWLKLALKHTFGFIDKITTRRRHHKASLSADFERMFAADFYNLDKLKEYFLKEHNLDLERNKNYIISKFNYRIKFAKEYFYFQNYNAARRQFQEAIKIKPQSISALFFSFLCGFPKPLINSLRKIL